MAGGSTKRVVVIKNIKSNFVEEAILILKDNAKGISLNGSTAGSCAEKSANSMLPAKKDYILAEAEDIISEFIKNNNINDKYAKNKRLINPALKKKRLNLYINSALAFSILVLAFIIYKLMS